MKLFSQDEAPQNNLKFFFSFSNDSLKRETFEYKIFRYVTEGEMDGAEILKTLSLSFPEMVVDGKLS